MNCVFCKINENLISSKTIYEDDIVKVFLDINPDSNGHCLIIPKKHYKDLFDIDEVTLNYILKICKSISDRLMTILKSDGITLVQNNGDVQEVKHFHIHLKPYYVNPTEMDIDTIYDLIKM